MFFTINRQDTIQTELEDKTGYTTKLRVHWTDNCNYETSLIESTFPFPDSVQEIRRTMVLKTEIISTGSNYYVFKAHRDNSNFITDTMWVAK